MASQLYVAWQVGDIFGQTFKYRKKFNSTHTCRGLLQHWQQQGYVDGGELNLYCCQAQPKFFP